jgi:hypothetical protein
MTIAGRNVSLGAIIAAIGGIVAIVASFLTWASSSIGGHSADLNGFDEGMKGGLAALVLGVIALALVALTILQVKLPSVAGYQTVPLGLVVVGVLLLIVVLLVYFTSILGDDSLSHMSDMVSQAGGSVSIGIAMILEVVAGIVVIVGGGLAGLKKE